MLNLDCAVGLMKMGLSSWVKLAGIVTLMILLGCGQQTDTADTKKKPVQMPAESTVSLKTYRVLDSAQFNNYFVLRDTSNDKYSRVLDFFIPDFSLDSLNKNLLYDVCFSDIDGFALKHPCSLDSALLVSLAKKLNYKDSIKGIDVKLEYVFYVQKDYDPDIEIKKDSLLIFKGFPDYSQIYLNDDSSYQSLCASTDGVKCDGLFALISISKKLFPDDVFFAHSYWPKERFKIYIDKLNFKERFDLDSLFSAIYDYSPLFDRENEFRKMRKLEQVPIIPFEMCYKNGFAIPCDLSSKDKNRVRLAVEKQGDTLVAVTYQRSWMVDDFALGGMSGRHSCKSSDGKHCDELFALVRRNDERMGSWFVLYRFNLKDFSFVVEELSHGDMLFFDGFGLYKKDGTHIADVR